MKRRGCLPSGRGCVGSIVVALVVIAAVSSAQKPSRTVTSGGLSAQVVAPTSNMVIAPTNEPVSFVVTSTLLPTSIPQASASATPSAIVNAPTTTRQAKASPSVSPTQFTYPLYYVSSGQAINVRADSTTTATKIGTLAPGASVPVLGAVQGQTVSNSTLWYKVSYQGQTGYIHSSLLADHQVTPRPAATAAPQRQVAPTSAPAVQQPVQPAAPQPQPTSIPANTNSGANSGSSGAAPAVRPRNCSTAVAMGLSAEQAAQYPGLDRDHDGVACYGD